MDRLSSYSACTRRPNLGGTDPKEVEGAAVVARAGDVHPRQGRRLEQRDGKRILRRDAVHGVHVGERRRDGARVSVVASGAVVPGVARVPARRALLEGVGNRAGVWAAVSA